MPKSNAPVERFSVAFEGFGEFERSALASFFRLAAKRGLIRGTGRYVKAKSAKTHAHPVALWRAA